MIPEWSEAAAELFNRAQKERLLPPGASKTVLDREGVMALLPHRDPFLLIDRVVEVDRERGLLAARYDLARARDVLAGHFPRHPVYPGVLQVEAVGQAGILLHLLQHGKPDGADHVFMTHILGARFLRPVGTTGELEIVIGVLEDGLFRNIVGQCIHDGQICSAAAAVGLLE